MSEPAPIEKADKRQHLLEVAERLFAQQGYEAVSIRQLAAEAGVNVAMVSYYFGSKENLFEALIESKIPRSREWLEAMAETKSSPWEKISQTIDHYVDKFFNGPAFHRVIMREMSLQQRPEHVRLITTHMARNLEIIGGFIREGQEKGLFRYVDVELTVATLFAAMSTFTANSSLICQLLKEKQEEGIFAEPHKIRLKNHLKALMQRHLLIIK